MKHYISFFTSILFLLIFANVADAQNGYEDVVYLKNGSIIHGIIIEQVPNESVKIQTKDKNIFVYRMDEISKMTKEELPVTRESRGSRRSKATEGERKKSGYTNITELTFGKSLETTTSTINNGYSTYVDETEFDRINNGPSIGLQTINGYQFSPYISAGLGLGINIYSGLVMLPVFAAVRVNFMASRLTPFAAIEAGYAYSRKEVVGGSLANDSKGGVMFAPAIGVKFFVIPKMALNLSLGFRYQEVQTNDEVYDSQYNSVGEHYKTHDLRLFNLKFGFTF